MSKSPVITPVLSLSTARVAFVSAESGLATAQAGQKSAVRDLGVACGQVWAEFHLFNAKDSGGKRCADWLGIESWRQELKTEIVALRVANGVSDEKAAKAYFDATFKALKGYAAPKSEPVGEVVGVDVVGVGESGGAQSSKRNKHEMLLDEVLAARSRLDGIVRDKEATQAEIDSAPFLRVAALILDGKAIPEEVVEALESTWKLL